MEIVGREIVAQFKVEKRFGFWGGVIAVVGEVVALRLAVAQCHAGIGVMSSLVETDTGFGVEEIVLLVDVEVVLVVEVSLVVVDEFVVVTVSLVGHITILQVGIDIPKFVQVVGAFGKGVAVQFLGVRVIVFVVAVFQKQ